MAHDPNSQRNKKSNSGPALSSRKHRTIPISTESDIVNSLDALPAEVFIGMEAQIRTLAPATSELPSGFLKQALKDYFTENSKRSKCPEFVQQRLLTAKEVRHILGDISAMTLHRIMRSGKLPWVKVTERRIGFDPNDVQDYINTRKVRASSPKNTTDPEHGSE